MLRKTEHRWKPDKKSDTYYYAPGTSRLTRNWCFELRQYLHFVDNSTLLPPGILRYDRLGRINSILRMLSERLVVVCNPELACTVVWHSKLIGGVSLGIWRCWQRRAWRRGETAGLYRMVICCDVWQDSRPVLLIATNSNTTKTETVKEKKRDCTFTYYKCPSSLSLYNHYMGGVNHNDQLCGYYNVHLKWRKYYKNIFWFCWIFPLLTLMSFINHNPKHDM